MLLVGCGAADGNTTSDAEGPQTTSRSYVSPLSEFLSPGSGSDDAAMAASSEKEKKVQESAAACMTEQGFDYVPFVHPLTDTSSMDDLDYASRAFVEKYGYGISTMNTAVSSTTESTVIDPNEAIVEAMCEAEREAYFAALWGGGMSVMGEPALGSEAAQTSGTVVTATEAGEAAPVEPGSTEPATTEPAAEPDR